MTTCPGPFVFDRSANGQQLKCLTVTDEFTKEGLAIDVDGRIRGQGPSCYDDPSYCHPARSNNSQHFSSVSSPAC